MFGREGCVLYHHGCVSVCSVLIRVNFCFRVQNDAKRMPPPKSVTIKKRKSKRPQDFLRRASAPADRSPDKRKSAEIVVTGDSDSDTACGFGTNWQPSWLTCNRVGHHRCALIPVVASLFIFEALFFYNYYLFSAASDRRSRVMAIRILTTSPMITVLCRCLARSIWSRSIPHPKYY